MGEKISATGQDRKSAMTMTMRACGLTPDQARSALEVVEARKPGWRLEIAGPQGRADLICYGKDNYTVKSR